MYRAIGRRIRALRQERALTQEQLAEKAGISLPFLGHIERGTRKLSIETLYKLMDALECTPEEILGFGGATQNIKLSTLLYQAAEALAREGR